MPLGTQLHTEGFVVTCPGVQAAGPSERPTGPLTSLWGLCPWLLSRPAPHRLHSSRLRSRHVGAHCRVAGLHPLHHLYTVVCAGPRALSERKEPFLIVTQLRARDQPRPASLLTQGPKDLP